MLLAVVAIHQIQVDTANEDPETHTHSFHLRDIGECSYQHTLRYTVEP